MLLLAVLWVLILLGVLALAKPDAGFPHDVESGVMYYGVWSVLFGLLVYVHHQLMTHAGQGELAVLLDAGTVGMFIVYRILGTWKRNLSSNSFYQNDQQYLRQYRAKYNANNRN